MKMISVIFLLLSIVLISWAEEKNYGLLRLNKIKEMNVGDALIPLDDGNFTKYVLRTPRLYHAVIFFTAHEDHMDCQPCRFPN